jgi:hypothetical protein
MTVGTKHMPQQFQSTQTGQTVFRYSTSERSGELPTKLYKYIDATYAESMIQEGALMFSTLSWFQSIEDPERGDGLEGTYKYLPVKGLDVTKYAKTGGEPVSKFNLPSHSLVSKAARCEWIFIYSTSLAPGLSQFDEVDKKVVCVEIFNPIKFRRHLKIALDRRQPRGKTFMHDKVRYYSLDQPSDNAHALPDRLTMCKHEGFSKQAEYRFAFGSRPDVFDFERVDYRLIRAGHTDPRPILENSAHRLLLTIGSLTDCCKIR